MAQIEKQFTFEAAHQLPGHRGKCAHLHGHSYAVTVALQGPIKTVWATDGAPLSDGGMVEDFDVLSQIVKPLIAERCHNRFLNDTIPVERTTAELIACWFFGEISRALHALEVANAEVLWVRVQETASSTATSFRQDWQDAGCPGWPEAAVSSQPSAVSKQ